MSVIALVQDTVGCPLGARVEHPKLRAVVLTTDCDLHPSLAAHVCRIACEILGGSDAHEVISVGRPAYVSLLAVVLHKETCPVVIPSSRTVSAHLR